MRPFPEREPPVVVVWLFRWLIARIMLGSALIKLRGDPCWTDFTCLVYHYETQPIPNPLSWWLHARPAWFHAVGVAFNHLVELIAPFLLVPGRRPRIVAGAAFVTFQLTLIASGNLSFLNWLTIVPALACFDDRFLAGLARRLRFSEIASAAARSQDLVAWALALLVGVLSVAPVLNLLSPRQSMNRSFEPFRLVNTYGAFGSVGKVRHEVILEGTLDAEIGPQTRWRKYEFPCKPGDVTQRPCIVSVAPI